MDPPGDKPSFNKLKRLEQKIEQFRFNSLFVQDQKRVYQELIVRERTENAVPEAEGSKEFWSSIWSVEKIHVTEAEWLVMLKSR